MPELRPEHLAQIGQPHLAPVDADDGVVGVARDRRGVGISERRWHRRSRAKRRQLRRARAVADGAGDRHVLAARRPPRPGAAAGRRGSCRRGRRSRVGNSSRSPKIAEQHVHVFGRRDAAEQHDLAVGPISPAQRPRALLERPPVARVVGIDVARRRNARTASAVTSVSGVAQAGIRRDDVDAAADDRIGQDRAARRSAARRSACRGSTAR